jgi:hypothetical protein
MITRHLFECWIRECSGLIRKRVSSAVSCSWSWSPLESLISSSTSAFRARELLCVIAIAQIHVLLPCIIFRWVSEGRKLLGSNNRQFVSQFVSLNGATLRAPCCVLVDRGLPAACWWVSEGRQLLGSNNREFVSQFVSQFGWRAPIRKLLGSNNRFGNSLVQTIENSFQNSETPWFKLSIRKLFSLVQTIDSETLFLRPMRTEGSDSEWWTEGSDSRRVVERRNFAGGATTRRGGVGHGQESFAGRRTVLVYLFYFSRVLLPSWVLSSSPIWGTVSILTSHFVPQLSLYYFYWYL